MTEGERMVWAAVFGPAAADPDVSWRQAAAWACDAVRALRAMVEDSEANKADRDMTAAMLGRETPEQHKARKRLQREVPHGVEWR